MLDFANNTEVYLAVGSTDLRKGFEGLAIIISTKFNLDPYSRAMFVFCNRNRSRLKILQWDGSGFWLYIKRLDNGSFHWPNNADDLKKVTIKELRWILDGLSFSQKEVFKEYYPSIVL
jgi:transposase